MVGQLACTGSGTTGVEGFGEDVASGYTALMYVDFELCYAVRSRWFGVGVTGQSRCRASAVVHTGTVNEWLSSRPNRPGALRLASQARQACRTVWFPWSLALGEGLFWLVLNTGGAVAVVILPSTIPYLGYRPCEFSHCTDKLPQNCRDWATSSTELEICFPSYPKGECQRYTRLLGNEGTKWYMQRIVYYRTPRQGSGVPFSPFRLLPPDPILSSVLCVIPAGRTFTLYT